MNPNDPIRQALLDAAEEEFLLALAHAPDAPGFSVRYQAWEEKFLRDPTGFSKRTLRPVWKTVLRWAACFLLVVSLSLGTLMAVSPQARAWVVSWVTEQYEDHVTYRFRGENLPTEALRDWVPTYLPDGYEQTDYIDLTNMVNILYNNDDPSMEIEFSYQLLTDGSEYSLDDEHHTPSHVSIHGMSGQFLTATNGTQNMLIWFDEANQHVFLLMSRQSRDILIQIAESVVLVK